MYRHSLIAPLLILTVVTCGVTRAEPGAVLVTRADVQFQPLNPARGDASPRAGVLWGDIGQDVPSGALIEFADGFSSPPHIHNITYRAVVISGAVHNDDPDAATFWMGPGSFWAQPAGESHITAAAPGSKATAFLEILEGPYLVHPPERAFDNGERPINLDAKNIVWLDASDVTSIDGEGTPATAGGASLAFLWGSAQAGRTNGTFLKLPSGARGELRGRGPWLRAVVIQGTVAHRPSGAPDARPLAPGSYFGARGGRALGLACDSGDACLIYVSTEGRYRFVQR